jgi:hypothetical protein
MYIEFKYILYYIYRPSGKNQFQGGGNKYKSDNFTETVSVLSYSSRTRRLLFGTGYEYDGNVFVAWVLQLRRAEVVTK